jgi:hypothetical protein
MRRLQQQFFMLGPPAWLKMKNSDAPAVKTFNTVFGKEARIVAVLLRPEWGNTQLRASPPTPPGSPF